MKRWRGLKALVHDAIDATTDLVGEGHASVHRRVQGIADQVPGLSEPTRLIGGTVHLGTRGTLASVKAVNRVVAVLTDTALDASRAPRPDLAPIPQRSDIVGTAPWVADAALGALNGSVGDHLARTGNPLDLGLQMRHGEHYLGEGDTVDEPTVVLVHGLGTTEWCWSLDAHVAFDDPAATLGTLLGEAHGLVPLYARYNTGRRVAENGRALAEALQAHAAGTPRIVLLGHSMGGLVARSACHYAAEAGHSWLDAVDWAISIGTPHQGAPLARFGASATSGLGSIDVPTTRILAQILAGRSAGIRDLEHGELLGRDPDALAAPEDRVVPLHDGIRYAFIGTTLTTDPEHPVGTWMGDLLVRTASAAGPLQHEPFPVHTETVGGVVHYRIQADPAVLAVLQRLLAGSSTWP